MIPPIFTDIGTVAEVLLPTTLLDVIHPHVPEKKFPYFIITISIVQVLIFNFGGKNAWLIFCYDPFRRHELWRFLSGMLVHAELAHLRDNVIFQLIFGLPLETVHHWKRILAVYMCGVLGGSLAVTVLEPQKYALGASSGVYGLLLAHLMTIILNWKRMNWFSRLFWLVFVGFELGRSIDSFVNDAGSNISHSGHFGGALGGFIAAVLVLRKFVKAAWQKKFQKALMVLSLVLLLIVLIINICFPSHFLPSEFNFKYQKTYGRHWVRNFHDSPKWQEIKDGCLAEPECANLYHRFVNNTLEGKLNE